MALAEDGRDSRPLIPTDADHAVYQCILTNRSFALISGAGSGKTTSLVTALDEIRARFGSRLKKNGQKVACITYTTRAAAVIRSRLGFDDLYVVNTIHSFMWGEIRKFQKDIREALINHRIPMLLEKAREKDTGRATVEAKRARESVLRLEAALIGLEIVELFEYSDAAYSDYPAGRLSHDDVIEIAGYLLAQRKTLRRVVGVRYPYVFVDEAQDTFQTIIDGLNLLTAGDELPVVGYFGDPWQQIYEGRAGGFNPPARGWEITKTENFRCSKKVVEFLNSFRPDVQQVAAGSNRDVVGSVEFRLIRAENPEGVRRRYSEPQLQRAVAKMDDAMAAWGLAGREDVIHLFLVRQMIARRLGFSALHQLFTGQFASTRAQENYESGEHYLLKPIIEAVVPLVAAHSAGRSREAIDILRRASPAYGPDGPNIHRKLGDMTSAARTHLAKLSELWSDGSVRDVLICCRDNDLFKVSDRLREQLNRPPRQEEYSEDIHAEVKGDWLADAFFRMRTLELKTYCDFILKNTAFSTQHGVKGEEYPNVVVVFDDVEAAWGNYSFSKLLTPGVAGDPTEGQRERGRRLAYVCFSRALVNLRILLFTQNPDAASAELRRNLNLDHGQIVIA